MHCSLEESRKRVLLRLPIAHAEGRLLFPRGREEECFQKLLDNDQVVFRFAKSDGKLAEGTFSVIIRMDRCMTLLEYATTAER